jgi:hypothetical protein
VQKYCVIVCGQNLFAEIDGVRKRLGFFTNVYLEAFTSADAGSRAIDFLKNDNQLREMALHSTSEPLEFSVTEVHGLESFDGVDLPRSGFALFEEN